METLSDPFVREYFTEQEQELFLKARELLEQGTLSKPENYVRRVRQELEETQNTLFKLNLDGVSHILCFLLAGIEAGVDVSKMISIFPEEYEKILRSFSVLNSIQMNEWEEGEIIHQIILAGNLDFRVVFIFLAWKLSKIRKIESYEQEERIQIAKECLDIFSPIAHRLGLYPIKSELETISFEVLHPDIYRSVNDQCAKIQSQMEKTCKSFAKKMHGLLEKADLKFEINFRNKLPYSIYRKSQKKNEDYKDLNDLVACRILTRESTDCYRILGMIHNEYLPMENRFKDYIVSPKPNGYQSLHTTLIMENGYKMEVQIRTYEMHQVSEKGIGAHWAYKKGQSLDLKQNEQILWVRELAEKLKNAEDPKEMREAFQRELYSDSIYVFSPRGKLIKLPKGAVVIDFAYAIHSDIGDRCQGAKINGAFRSIRSSLRNGDQVEVLTQKNVRPNSSWLQYALTNKAQYHIRAELKKIKRAGAEELGKEILRRALKRNSIPVEKFEENPEFLKYLEKNKFSDSQEFLEELGMGTREVASLINFLNFKPPKKTLIPEKFLSKFKLKKEERKLIGAENLPVRFAKCCQPVAGDRIVGIIKQNGVIGVHTADCESLKGNLDSNRIIELHWQGTYPDIKPVRFEFHFPYSIKTFNKITKWIDKHSLEIEEANLKQQAGEGIYSVVINFPETSMIPKFQKKIESFGDIRIIRS